MQILDQLMATVIQSGQQESPDPSDLDLLLYSPCPVKLAVKESLDKTRALDLLVKSDKIVVIATHDPVLALSAGRRLVFKNGAVCDMMIRSAAEERLLARLEKMEKAYARIRACLRQGQSLE